MYILHHTKCIGMAVFMRADLEKIKEQFTADVDGKKFTRASLEQIHSKYVGRKGLITDATARLKEIPKEEKPQAGKILNEVKNFIEEKLRAIRNEVENSETPSGEAVDHTLPERKSFVGHTHPLTQALEEIKTVFYGMGFTVEDGPEVELDYYNFEAVNIPKGHPARDMQDTFFINDNVVLRTHTSPVQARTMERQKPPIRMICPGRVYRKDTPDATHSPFFNQVEGLVVDAHVSFADLKGTLSAFVHRLFGRDIGTRFRPSYFSFTEPSAEVDIACLFCKGKGCRVCKNSGWIEIMGSGMVHPKLFEHAGYEKGRYTGYAFGMGVDRIAMLIYDVNDLRLFFENDVRFLEQF
jgi:phenylalanyl-tRNA synthetase alpha chain